MPKRPPIPPEVALELRQDAGFGCCKCGAGIYEYHHIIEWNKIHHYDPKHMMVLCPNDHGFVGAMSPEDQYEIKENPQNIRDGRPYGTLVLRRGQGPKIDLGGNVFIPRGNAPLLTIDDVVVLGAGFDQHGKVSLWLRLYDECNRLLAAITDNEWSANSDLLWDVIAKHQYIKIRQRKSRILFEIDLTKEVPFIKGHFWGCGKRIWIKRSSIKIDTHALHLSLSGNEIWGFSIFVKSLPGGKIVSGLVAG